MEQEVIKTIYKFKTQYILDNPEKVDLLELNLTRLFSYNMENMMGDEFLLNTIQQTYEKIEDCNADEELYEKLNTILTHGAIDI